MTWRGSYGMELTERLNSMRLKALESGLRGGKGSQRAHRIG